MLRLTLVRHAETNPPAPGGADYNRMLTDRGKADCHRLGAWILDQLPAIDCWLVSGARRTQQTADLLLAHSHQKAVRKNERALYQATEQDLIQRLSDLDAGIQHALLIGHNPCISQLAVGLTGGRTGHFSPLELSHLQLPLDEWSELVGGIAEPLYQISPDQIKAS